MTLKVLSIIVAAGLPYLFTLDGDFVFDDSEAIIKNKDVESESWIAPFYNDFWGTNITSNLSHKSYRPLTILTFKLNYHLSGRKLVSKHYKTTNLLCHITCCLLLYLTLKTLVLKFRVNENRQNLSLAYLSTILFAVHPVHVEAISGIVGRADMLAAISFFASFIFYTKGAEGECFSYFCNLSAVVLAGVSMLFKENGVTVLGLCLLFDILTNVEPKNQTEGNPKNYLTINKYQINLPSVKRIIFITLCTIILLYGRWLVMGGKKPDFQPIDNPAAFSDDLLTRVTTYSYVYFLNMLLLIWPQWLCYDWSMGCVPLVDSVLDFRIRPLMIMFLYAMLTCVAVLHKNNNGDTKRIITFAVSMIVVPFLPASNILFPVGFVLAERVLYIPSAGYCLLVAIGLNKIIYHIKSYKVAVIFLFYLTIIVFCLRSYQRSKEWQSEYKLFVSGLNVCPLNAKVHYNVAKVADAKEEVKWAIDEYREAIRLYPKYYQAMNNLANLLKNHKKYDEAEMHLRNALIYKEDFPAAWMNLGIVLASTKRYVESETAYKNALKYRKNYPDCLYNLGNLFLELSKPEEAEKNWLLAININPSHNLAWTNLLALLDNTGRLNKALQLIPKAIDNLPESPSLNFAIGNIYGKLDRYEDAEAHFTTAIRLFGDKVQTIHYGNFGVLYHRWKKYKLAEEMYLKALKLDPKFKSAKKNLQSLQNIKKAT